MAVAASVGYCALLSLKPAQEIVGEIDHWDPKRPQSFAPATEVCPSLHEIRIQ